MIMRKKVEIVLFTDNIDICTNEKGGAIHNNAINIQFVTMTNKITTLIE